MTNTDRQTDRLESRPSQDMEDIPSLHRYLFFRFDIKHHNDVIKYITDKKIPALLAFETAKNEHLHGICQINTTTEDIEKNPKRVLDTQRTKLYRCLSQRTNDGSKECRIVEPTAGDYWAVTRYICKGDHNGYTLGNPQILINSNDTDVQLYHEWYWEVNKTYDESKPAKSKKKQNSPPSYIKGTIEFMEAHRPGITEIGGFRKYKINNHLGCCKLYVLAWYTKVVKTFPNQTQLENLGRTVYSQILAKNYPETIDEHVKFYSIAKKFLMEYEILDFEFNERNNKII